MRARDKQKWIILASAVLAALGAGTIVFALLANIDVHIANDLSERGKSSQTFQLGSICISYP